MARKAGSVAIACSILPLLIGDIANAAVNRTLDYGLALEANSDESDRVFSSLSLNISDDFGGGRYTGEYSLDSELFADHRENDYNDQHRGSINSRIGMLPATAWWNLNADVGVLPVDGDSDIEEFSSQNVLSVSTGPTLALTRRMRGSLELALLATEVSYSESSLDSTQSELSLIWDYPLDLRSSIGLEARGERTEYREPENAARDFDQSSAEIFYRTRLRNLQLDTSVSANRVDGEARSTDFNGAEISLSYELNSRSRLLVSGSDSLRSVEEFNQLPGNLSLVELDAGVLRNRRAEIGYRYELLALSLSADIFQNDSENVVEDDAERNRSDGVELRMADEFYEDLRFSGSYLRTDSRRTGIVEEEIDLSLSYLLYQSGRTTSRISVFVERDSTDGDDQDNFGVRYQLSSRIF